MASHQQTPRAHGSFVAVARLIRPGDWVKNLFVAPALLFAPGGGFASELAPADLTQTGRLLPPLVATFIAFCLLASGFYCLNDALDADEDAKHPVKRTRPVPSGAVARGTATALGVVLIFLGLAAGQLVGPGVGVALAAYAVLQAFYNAGLKRVPLADAAVVAGGFALRTAAGAAAIQVAASPWLLVFVFSVCLFLCFVKRLSDVHAAAGGSWSSPAGYADTDRLRRLLAATATVVVVAYLLLTLSPQAREALGPRSMGLALLAPLVLVLVWRFYRRAVTGAVWGPLTAASEDRVVLGAATLYAVGGLTCLYAPAVERLLGVASDFVASAI